MSVARLAASKIPLKIPKYIERGPTDILKALASSIKFVPDQPEAAFQDDPYLLPHVPNDRKNFILAKMSGVRTARFFLNKYPELFFRDDSEPKVASFQPSEMFDQNMEFSVEDIKWCIDNNDPVNAVVAYNWLEEKKIKLDDETLLQFLEFMCFTNEDNPSELVDFEMSKYSIDAEENLVKYTWKSDGVAIRIFNQVKDSLNPPRAYSAMIAGLSKYNQHTSAKQLFLDFIKLHPDKGLTPSAYNGLIYSASKLCSSIVTANEAIEEIVNHMSSNLVKPNLRTFNNILAIIREYRTTDEACLMCIRFLNDMKSLNIEPSLYTFALILNILSRQNSGRNYVDTIQNIMNHVEANFSALKEIRDERDVQFFNICVSQFTYTLNSVNLTKKLYKLYLSSPNLFLSSKNQQRFFNLLFKFTITTDSLENIMLFYETYVPLHFQPALDTYEALTEALDLYQADEETINKIGNDLIRFKIAKYLKNDTLFRKNPKYVEELENMK